MLEEKAYLLDETWGLGTILPVKKHHTQFLRWYLIEQHLICFLYKKQANKLAHESK